MFDSEWSQHDETVKEKGGKKKVTGKVDKKKWLSKDKASWIDIEQSEYDNLPWWLEDQDDD